MERPCTEFKKQICLLKFEIRLDMFIIPVSILCLKYYNFLCTLFLTLAQITSQSRLKTVFK